MQGDDVVEIQRAGAFSHAQAQRILPVVRRITQDYSQKVELLMAKLESVPTQSTDHILDLETTINELIKTWHEKIRKLGGVPKGLWLVDFDNGQGYYCWKYPEPELLFWHSYTDGFSNRRRVPQNDAFSP